MSECRSCHEPIEWVITEYGRRQPLDLGDFDDGNVVIVGHDARGVPLVVTLGVDKLERLRGLGAVELRRAHHRTCPQGNDWRR